MLATLEKIYAKKTETKPDSLGLERRREEGESNPDFSKIYTKESNPEILGMNKTTSLGKQRLLIEHSLENNSKSPGHFKTIGHSVVGPRLECKIRKLHEFQPQARFGCFQDAFDKNNSHLNWVALEKSVAVHLPSCKTKTKKKSFCMFT